MQHYDKYFTKERLKRYLKDGGSIEKYFGNIRLSKELYAVIALFEVAFRNQINSSISKNIRPNWLLDKNFAQDFLVDKELTVYNQLYCDLQRKKQLSEGKIVAGLNLGFWVNLFDKKYKVRIWHRKGVFEDVFEAFDIRVSNRISYIYPRLKEIQYIRNRISHHEAIFDYKNGLDNFYINLIQCLQWVAPDLETDIEKVCEFSKCVR